MTATNTMTKTILETCGIWDTHNNSENWEPEFLKICVTWQSRVTLDSIRNSCDVSYGLHMYILSLFINPSLEMKDVPLGQLVLAVLKSKHTVELCGIVQLNVPVFPMSSFFFPLRRTLLGPNSSLSREELILNTLQNNGSLARKVRSCISQWGSTN